MKPLCLCELSMGSLGLSEVSGMHVLVRRERRTFHVFREMEFSKFVYRKIKAK